MFDTDRSHQRELAIGNIPVAGQTVHADYHAATPKKRWRFNFALLPALAVAMLPKCPLCLMSVLSVVGLGSLISVTWLFPLTVSLLGLVVAVQAWGAYRRRSYKPVLMSLAGAAAVLLGRFQIEFMPLVYAGMAMLIGASLWNYWVKKKASDEAACRC